MKASYPAGRFASTADPFAGQWKTLAPNVRFIRAVFLFLRPWKVTKTSHSGRLWVKLSGCFQNKKSRAGDPDADHYLSPLPRFGSHPHRCG